MKKQIISGFSLLFLAALLAVGYQNCGDVGGISPLSGTDPGVDEGTNALSGEFLALRFTSNPSIVNDRVLVANFDCDYRPFDFSSHLVHITVSSTEYNYSANLSTVCSYPNFTHQQTLPISTNGVSFDRTKTHTVHAQVYGLYRGERIIGDGKSHDNRSVSPGMVFPASTDLSSHDFSSLVPSGQISRDITVTQGIDANYHQYLALRGSLEFTMGQMLPTNSQQVYALFEILPYANTSGLVAKYRASMSRFTVNNNNKHRLLQHFVDQGQAIQDVLTQASGHTYFAQGKRYKMEFIVLQSGQMSMSFTDVANPSQPIFYLNSPLSGFDPSSFSKTPMVIRLGKSPGAGTNIFSGFTNIRVKYRLCGYLDNRNTPDNDCLSAPL